MSMYGEGAIDDLEASVSRAKGKQARWAGVAAVPQFAENADTSVQATAKWSKVYALFGATGETQQDEVFAAVNLYLLKNGASPRGKYTKPIRTAGGIECESGKVVQVTGKLEGEIRQFMRGRLEDSYLFLKYNSAVRSDEALAAVAENQGVPREFSYLLADWLGKDCPYFVGPETDMYAALRSSKIAMSHAKSRTASPPRDRVTEKAPETKMLAEGRRSYNDDLF